MKSIHSIADINQNTEVQYCLAAVNMNKMKTSIVLQSGQIIVKSGY